jgi:tetratricopeptide (TPR) repeat protein
MRPRSDRGGGRARTAAPRPSPFRRLLLALLAAAVGAAAGCATAPPPTIADPGFPSPLAGPGVPELAKGDARLLEQGWDRLRAGDPAAARQAAGRATASAAARLLDLQAALVEGRGEATGGLRELTASAPGYAVAWLTLSVAAERAGDEAVALSAARQGASLWSKEAWQARADQLRARWVLGRLTEAARLVAAGQAEEGLALAERALALEPANRDAILTRARALIALGSSDQAEAALTPLASDPDALLLSGSIAERRRDWETAMDLYDSLPADYPERASSLRRAKQQWRLSNLPPCARQAIASPDLTRAELAILLVSLAPQLETVEGESPPVLSDIVDLPCYREILTAARLELVAGDPREHRFFPRRPVQPEELRSAVDGLCHVLDLTPPLWCEEAEPGAGCTAVSAPVSGEQVAELVSRLTEAEGP